MDYLKNLFSCRKCDSTFTLTLIDGESEPSNCPYCGEKELEEFEDVDL